MKILKTFLLSLIYVLLVVFTTSAASADFSFGAAGDYASGTNFQATAAQVGAAGLDFHLALGDLSYDTNEQSWCTNFKNQFNNVLLISGNHDNGESTGGNINTYITHCPYPLASTITGSYGKQYYFDYPATNPIARFIMIVPGLTGALLGPEFNNTNYNAGNPGYMFTENAINNARTAGIKWVIVGLHKNYISTMEKGNGVGTDLMNLLFTKKVDLILQGHEHGYERTKQLKCAVVNSYDPSCVVDSDNNLTKGEGTIIHVIGTGGQTLRALNPGDSENAYFKAADNTTYGLGKFTLTDTQMSFNFIRSAGGAFTDSFTITESEVPTPTGGPTSTPTPTPGGDITFTKQITVGTDDVEENESTGAINTNSSDLEHTFDGPVKQTIGTRFTGINIPKNAVISSAYLEYTAKQTQPDATDLVYYAEGADNSGVFATTAFNVSARAKTTSNVAWNAIPVWSVGGTYTTPNLSTLVQEVINRPGWISGNPLTFIVTGTGHRTAYTYNGSQTNAPKLVVVYSLPTGPTPTSGPSNNPTPTTEPCGVILPTNTGVATMSISIPEAGTYKVWSRIQGTGDGGNSYYIQVNNGCGANVGDLNGMPANTWTWVDYKDGDTGSPTAVTFDTAGTHTLKLIGREPGTKVDKLIFTQDLTCLPQDTGTSCDGSTPTLTPSPTPNVVTETWTGVDGAAWPASWVFKGATTQIQSKDIQANQGRILSKLNATGKLFVYLKNENAVNSNQLVQLRISSSTPAAGLFARRADTATNTYYFVQIQTGSNKSIKLKKVVNGTTSNVILANRSILANTDYNLRFETTPDTDPTKTLLRVKVWETGTSEPPTYNISTAHAEPMLQGVNGRFGLFYTLASEQTVWVDNYSASFTQ